MFSFLCAHASGCPLSSEQTHRLHILFLTHTGQCSLIVEDWMRSLTCKDTGKAQRGIEAFYSDQCHSFPLSLPILIGIHKTHVARVCGNKTITVETQLDLF